MKGYIQSQVAPPVSRGPQVFSDAKVTEQAGVKDSNDASDVDFKSLLYNSSIETKREREAKKNGDLTADTKEEFMRKLAEQTKQEQFVPNNKLGKDDFLKLFVEQLKNQDPLNPDSGADLAAKLAQFNSVEQMMNVNKSLESMAKAQNLDRSMMMTNFIGKEMTVHGGRLRIDDGKLSGATYRLPKGAARATLSVRDGAGHMVFDQELGSVPEGQHKLAWDGRNKNGQPLPSGLYTFHIAAADIDSNEIPVEITSKVKITGVDVKDKDGGLFTNFGRIHIDDVRAVGEPGFAKVAKKAKSKVNQPLPPATPELAQSQAPQPSRSALGSAPQAANPAAPVSNQMPATRPAKPPVDGALPNVPASPAPPPARNVSQG